MSAPAWELRRAGEPPAGRVRSAGPPTPALRFGSEALLLTREGELASDAAAGAPLGRLAALEELHLVIQVGRLFELEHPEEEVLYRKGRYLLVRLPPERAAALNRTGCFTVKPVTAPDTIFEIVPRARRAAADTAGPSPLLARLSRDGVRSIVDHLVSYGERKSTGTKFRVAAEWAAARFRSDGYEVTTTEISVGTRKSRNVVAERRGSGADRDAVVVAAHLDSINHEDTSGSAPGADDNASGSAGVLELARCLAGSSPRRDLRFILFGGEEQGLFGSTEYVAALPAPARIHAVLNMDMIATVNGTPTPTVLLEGGAVSGPVIDDLADAAHRHTSLTVQKSLHYANSDHVPFIDAAIPAVLSIEGADSTNDQVHSARDTTVHLDYDLMMDILAMQLAFVGKACGIE